MNRLLTYLSPRWHPDAGPLEQWLDRWYSAGWRHVPASHGGSTEGVPVNIGGIDYRGFCLVRDEALEAGAVIPHDRKTMRALEQPDPFL